MTERAIYRILDASLNRVAEGLRTIEEFARFVLDSPGATEVAKQLRHQLSAAAQSLDADSLLSGRDTVNDCGTQIEIATEFQRGSAADVAEAAFSRTQQSLRSLEEYGKLVSIEFARQIESIRYQVYTLEKQMILASSRALRLESTRLYLLVDFRSQGERDAIEPIEPWLSRLEALASAGADVIQIRDKRADDRTLYERCKRAAERLCLDALTVGKQRCQLIINDRADVAAAVNADGVHVGQEELPVAAVRQVVGEHKLVGLSTHSIQQVREAEELGVDYIGCGPTFPSRTKTFDQYVGVELAAWATNYSRLPAFAIGGINLENLRQLKQAGVTRIVVGAAVWGQRDEVRICQQVSEALRRNETVA